VISEEIHEITTDDGTRLTSVLEVPRSPAMGAVVILQGSGNVSYDGDISSDFLGFGLQSQKPLLSRQIAHILAQKGIASLRYSKRGVDDPSLLRQQTIAYLQKDARAALRNLQARFPGLKSGFVGFSEGAVVATLAAQTAAVDSLFLLAPLTRPFLEILQYQFVTWPVELLRRTLDLDGDGIICDEDFRRENIRELPLTRASVQELLGTQNQISLEAGCTVYYQGLLQAVLELGRHPPLSDWAESMFALPDFKTVASNTHCPVYVYQADEDAQVASQWVKDDVRSFPALVLTQTFPGLGHAFCPMAGTYGQIKTSGPFDQSFLECLGRHVAEEFKI